MEDIDNNSLNAYRNIYKSTKLNHPWIELDDKEFLTQIGAYKKDRKSNQEGLTFAGLLMFGKFRSILDGVPNYLVDYQEQTENDEDRWIDRVTTDGTWSGNLFEFSQKVYRKLTSELKVPFKLKDSFQRVDESNIHEAIREALVNSLIHANYSGRIGIQIVKHPKGFSFRNPGLLRVSKEEAFKGGHSDCRNRTLQKIFQYIGMGEQAGSGFPKMLRAWIEQHWQFPYLEENTNLETTTLFMPTISLFPKEIQEELENRFGKEYINLDKDARLALILATVDGEVSNIRLSDIGAIHPADTSKILKKLVDKNLLVSEGIGRGTKYYINKEFKKEEKIKITPEATPEVVKLLEVLDGEMSTIELMQIIGLKDEKHFRNNYRKIALNDGLIELTIPDKPRSPNQKYRLTKIGNSFLEKIKAGS